MISFASFKSLLKQTKKTTTPFHKIKLCKLVYKNKLSLKWELYQSKTHVENIHYIPRTREVTKKA